MMADQVAHRSKISGQMRSRREDKKINEKSKNEKLVEEAPQSALVGEWEKEPSSSRRM